MTHLRRHGIVLCLILLGAASGFLLEKALPADQRSTVLLEVSPVIRGGATTGTSSRAADEVELVTTTAVLGAAMAQVGWTDLESFRGRLEVKWVTGTPLITVSFRDSQAELANEAANAVAANFVERRRSLESDSVRAPFDELGSQIDRVQAETTALTDDVVRRRVELGPSPSPDRLPTPATRAAREELKALELLLRSRREALTNLRISRDDLLQSELGGTARVVQFAQSFEIDRTNRSELATAFGILGGLLILLARRGVRIRHDRRLLRHRQAALLLGVPDLGALRPLSRRDAASLFVRDRPASPEADDFRSLCVNLLVAMRGARRSLLVTAASPRQDAAVLATNLAFALVERGRPTILVDADRRHPSFHQTFGVDPDYGVLDLLANPSDIRASLSRFAVADGLFVIPVGRATGLADQLLGADAFKELLGELAAAAEGLVVVTCGPLLESGDSHTLSRSVDGVLLVADPMGSPPSQTRRAIVRAQQAGATVIGILLDRVQRTSLDPLPAPVAVPPGVEVASRAADRRGTVARGLLFGWAALLGVQFALLPGFNIAASDFVLAALLLIVLTDRDLRRRAFSLPAKLRWFFATMSLAMVVGSSVTAFTFGFLPSDAWLNKGLGLGVLAAAIASVRAVANTRQSVFDLLRALLLGAIVSTAVSLALWLNVLPLAGLLPPPPLRFTGFLTNPNAAALYYTVGLLLLFAIFGGAPLRLGRWSRIAGVILLGIGNVLTVSLSALVSGVMAFAFLGAGLPRGRGPAALALLAVLVVALPSLSAVVAPATAGGDVFDRASASRSGDADVSLSLYAPSAAEAKGSSVFDRLAIDAVALNLWGRDVESVVFGIGLGAFSIYAGLTDEIGQSVIIHNSYLWLVAEMGLLGLAAMALLLWYVVELSIRVLRQLDAPTAVPFVATFVLFLVWWQFNEGLYQRVFWLLLGAASVLADLSLVPVRARWRRAERLAVRTVS